MQPRINPKKLYLTPELALKLGLSARTLESWRRCNVHPGLTWKRIGRRVTYLGSDVLEFLSDSMSPSPKAKGRRRGAR